MHVPGFKLQLVAAEAGVHPDVVREYIKKQLHRINKYSLMMDRKDTLGRVIVAKPLAYKPYYKAQADITPEQAERRREGWKLEKRRKRDLTREPQSAIVTDDLRDGNSERGVSEQHPDNADRDGTAESVEARHNSDPR